MSSPVCSLYVWDELVSRLGHDVEESIAVGLEGVDEVSCGTSADFFCWDIYAAEWLNSFTKLTPLNNLV